LVGAIYYTGSATGSVCRNGGSSAGNSST
jgi:hypothetical protein